MKNKRMLGKQELFELAQGHRNLHQFDESNHILFQYIENYSDDSRLFMIHTLLGANFYDMQEYHEAIICYRKAIEAKPGFEMASLGLYLCYAEMGNTEAAIAELRRFLKDFPANLYKDTLYELLEGLSKGYATKFKNIITDLALKNNVVLSGDM